MEINDNTIVRDPNEILRTRCPEVELPLNDEDREHLQQMLEYVRNTHDEQYCSDHNCRASVGIAAPQIGLLKKMLAISIEDGEDLVEFALVNPKIVSNSTRLCYLENGESCLSVVPDVEGIVPRYYRIKVRAYNLITDRIEEIKLKGYPSIVMQHEIDHLYGKLYYDHINPNDPWQPIDDAVVI